MVTRYMVSLVLWVPFVASAAAQTSAKALGLQVVGRAPSVVGLRSVSAWPWVVSSEGSLVGGGGTAEVPRFQQAAPGWLEGRAAAEEQDVRARRVLGFIGGLAIGFFGAEAAVQDNEPEYFGKVALAGAGLVGLTVLRIGNFQPSASIMKDVESRGSDYTQAFLDGYSSRLTSRRVRAGLVGSALGVGVGAGVLMLVVAALCGGGDC